jgi:hypothetical protein
LIEQGHDLRDAARSNAFAGRRRARDVACIKSMFAGARSRCACDPATPARRPLNDNSRPAFGEAATARRARRR